LVPVRTGLDDGSFAEIISGELQASDQVIIGENSGGAAPVTQSAAPRLRL
jgi:hypothetical protein